MSPKWMPLRDIVSQSRGAFALKNIMAQAGSPPTVEVTGKRERLVLKVRF